MNSFGSNLLLPPAHARVAAINALQKQREEATAEAPARDDFEVPGAFNPIDESGNRMGDALWVPRDMAMDIPEYVWARIPEPTGWRILVQEVTAPLMSKGGVWMPDEVTDWHNAANFIGRVLAMGPSCYRHKKFLMVNDEGENVLPPPWCAPGEWVTFAHYSGTPRKIVHEGIEWRFRFIFDENVEGVAPTPEGLKVYIG